MREQFVWLAIISVATATNAEAETARNEHVLYSFEAFGTGFPVGRLVRLRSGELVGAASGYGNTRKPYGQVFMLKPGRSSWRHETLVAFDGQNGTTPMAGLTPGSKGTFYGTTSGGGAYGSGTIFELVHSGHAWTGTVLDAFHLHRNGADPEGRLVYNKGTLYGTTAGGNGEIFEWAENENSEKASVLHVFHGADGRKPLSGLIHDRATGAYYGTTTLGGASGCGTVFAAMLSGATSTIKTLYSFRCARDGANPQSSLVEDSTGALFGTTYSGGDTRCGYRNSGCGTLFKLARGPSGWKETVLHRFAGNDGAYPQDRDGLATDPSGTLYGTASQGGNYNRGVVFKVSMNGNDFAVLHNFGALGDGEYPEGGVTEDAATGTLYGTTFSGGAYGYGAVYQITQHNEFAEMH